MPLSPSAHVGEPLLRNVRRERPRAMALNRVGRQAEAEMWALPFLMTMMMTTFIGGMA